LQARYQISLTKHSTVMTLGVESNLSLHGIALATPGMMTQSNIRHAVSCMQTCDSSTLLHNQYDIKHVVESQLKLHSRPECGI